MLTTYLQGNLAKFIIIEDDLEERSEEVFQFKLSDVFSNPNHIIYFQFNFNLAKNNVDKCPLSAFCDFTKFSRNEATKFLEIVNSTKNGSIIIIDSLAHMIHKIGGREAYKVLADMCRAEEVTQIITQLHSDLLTGEEDVLLHVVNLANLHIKMERKLDKKPRLSYTFKKGRGKVIKAIEEYELIDGELRMMPPSELKIATLLQDTSKVNIDALTSFKIELSEQDKVNRTQVNLPFLPKSLQQTRNASNDCKTGQIDYVFDEGDDWDAEDPDDDLDI